MSRITRMFGRDEIQDPRDHKYQLRATVKTRRRSRTWSAYGWHGDQGREGSCVGFGWAHWLHSQPIRQYLDPIGIYKLAQYIDEWEGVEYHGTSVRAGAKVLQMLGAIEKYEWAWDADSVANHILVRSPVVIGVNWHEGMNVPDEKGLMSLDGKILGGHCVLVTGYNSIKQQFKIKNSYGTQWGNKGYGCINFTDLDNLLKNGGEACVGVETKIKIPRNSR